MRLLSPRTSIKLRTLVKASPLRACFSLFQRKNRQRLTLASIGLVVFIALGVVMPAEQALAVTKTASLAPGDQAASFAYYKALRTCMATGYYKNTGSPFAGANTMSQQNAVDYEWFNGRSGTGLGVSTNGVNVGVINDPRGTSGDGAQNCGDSEGRAWIKKAITLWGYSSGPQFLCDLGFTRQVSGITCTATPAGANNDFVAPGDAPTRLDRFWQETLGNSSLGTGSITKLGGAYALYLKSFNLQCRATAGGSTYAIQTFADGSKTPTTSKFEPSDRDRGTSYKVTIYDQRQMTCAELANAISDPNSAVVLGYQAYLKAHDGKDPTAGTGTVDCTATDTACSDAASACVIEGIGWLVCPVVNFLANIADAAFGFLANTFLQTDPTAFETDTPTYKAWVIMRNIANVLFVVAFLVIIFSQLTGSGITNYGIKKMLPRLVIAAILVNISFFISQVAVDVSNILGYSINNVFKSVTGQVMGDTYNAGASEWATGNTFSTVAVGILGFAGATVALYALLSTFGPVLIAVVLALILMLFILIARQALIILLVVLSPIAFVALLLPNTESLFKQWRKMFTAMLLLFPIIALVFGASTLASAVLQGAFTGAYTGEGSNWFGQIVASAVLVLPLFVVPVLLKKSLDGVPMLGQMASKWSSRANGRISSKAKEGYQKSTMGRGAAIRKQARENYRTKKFAERVASGGLPALTAKGINVLTPQGKYSRNRVEQYAEEAAEKAFESDISTAAIAFKNQHINPDTQIQDIAGELTKAIKSKDKVKARAAQSILLNSGGAGLDTLHKTLELSMRDSSIRNSEVGISLRTALNNAGLKGKDNALASYAYSDKSLSELRANTSTFKGLSSVELAGQRTHVLQDAAANGAISQDQATAVLADNVSKDMDPAKMKLFQAIASGSSSSPSGSTTPTAPTAPMTPASPTAPNASAADRARTTGSPASAPAGGVFNVNHSGETTHTPPPPNNTPPQP